MNPRAALTKAVLNDVTVRACAEHEGKLAEAAEDRATVYSVPPHERDSAGCWCDFCTPQGDITHTKESDQ